MATYSDPRTGSARPKGTGVALPQQKVWPLSAWSIALICFGGGLLLFLLFLAVPVFIFLATYSSGSVLPNVSLHGPGIPNVDLGGVSPPDALTRLDSLSVNQAITLRDGTRSWTVSASDLGIKVDSKATADIAVNTGHADIFNGLNTILTGVKIAPIYTLDIVKTQAALTALTNTINTKASDDPLATRRILNINATIDRLPPDLSMLLQNPTLNLAVDQQQGPRTTYTVERGEELALIAKKFNVPMKDIITLNQITDADTIYPGQKLIIPAAGIWQPSEKDAPPAPLASGKSIVVSLSAERIYAYQDGHLVHSTLMSSGLPGHETVRGDYHIYVKYASTRMTGPGYDIPDVPWTMYFYQGYGIHGAYWHNDFGREMSHGCVNLDTAEAKWFYDFSPIGTLVHVIPA